MTGVEPAAWFDIEVTTLPCMMECVGEVVFHKRDGLKMSHRDILLTPFQEAAGETDI